MRTPLDQYEHLMLAFLIWSYSYNLDFISRFQRRGRAANNTPGSKGKLQGVGKIIIPTHRLFFRAICIHDDLHLDTLFAFFIFGAAIHMYPPLVDKSRYR